MRELNICEEAKEGGKRRKGHDSLELGGGMQ